MVDLTKKWKRGALTALSVALAATLSFGVAACAETPETPEEEEKKVAPADTQVIKNGNFEFYSDKLIDPDDNGKPLKKLGIINSPDSWTFTSGSPSSEKKSGVIDTADWAYYTATGGSPYLTEYEKDSETVKTFADIATAYAHWEDADVSAYDRLHFLDLYDEEIDALASGSDEAKLFAKYSYNVDFEDVETFAEDMKDEPHTSGGAIDLHPGANGDGTSTGVLMIHNSKTSDDGIRGTGQFYTSSTTVTLSAGTSAKITAWVRTDKLVHYKGLDLKARGGAYIGITNTVGGTSQDQMLIENIHTDGEWQQYTVYVRASTFATTTFRIVLGLGQGTTDDKYFAVDGYAFFDDVAAEIIPNEDFETAVFDENGTGEQTVKPGIGFCTVDDEAENKRFDYDKFPAEGRDTFALDLYAGFEGTHTLLQGVNGAVLTEEVSGSNTYTSKEIDPSLDDAEGNYAKLADNLAALKTAAESNAALGKVLSDKSFTEFPFDETKPIAMLLSENGAAYTLKLNTVTLPKGARMLVSFFAKTCGIPSGLTGASALLADGENGAKTAYTAFDTNTIATVDIDSKVEEKSDIYKGWVQCFFFVENDTENEQTFRIELNYGPTTIIGTDKFDYTDGYAAFANFETKVLTKTEYGYASTGDRAKKVSLTGETEETQKFDSVSAVAEKDIETGPALPANFREVLGGSDYVQSNDPSKPNVRPDGITAGLLNSKYAEEYSVGTGSWKDVLGDAAGAVYGNAWWKNLFGNARQPLVIVNDKGAEPVAYGYFGETATISSGSYQRISMRVKVSAGASAHIYLTETSAGNGGSLLRPVLPSYTYWYDDDGNIVSMDPSSDDYDENGEILYTLQPNGLYRKEGSNNYYANLSSFETDSEGNLVTKDGTIAFYGSEGKFYAYCTEDGDNKTYSTEVFDLHSDPDLPLRYNYAGKTLRGSEIVVTGADVPEWVTVNFYIHTGNEAKSYRLEVWAGSRDGKETLPAGGYVFFDNYNSASASSDYDTYLGDTVKAAKDAYNKENGKNLGDEGYLGKNDNLPSSYADYYTFTFFDANSYLRYDETADADEKGNPWIDYAQSGYEEQLVTLYYENRSSGSMPNYSLFLNYAASEVTVEAAQPDTDDTDSDTDSGTGTDDGNIWLLLSSGSLAVVLLAVIVLVVVRRLVGRFSKRQTKVKPAKKKQAKKSEDDTPDEE